MNNYYYDFSGYYPQYKLCDLEPSINVKDNEYGEWCKAHNIYGATADSCIRNILNKAKSGESFVEASARLGYGNNRGKNCKEYYYKNHILILEDNEQ